MPEGLNPESAMKVSPTRVIQDDWITLATQITHSDKPPFERRHFHSRLLLWSRLDSPEAANAEAPTPSIVL